MLGMSSGMPTFVWFGSLATFPPRAVIERCQQLAVSARAELRSGERRARIDIVGGEVASVDGADPKVVAGWTDGSFRVTQAMPDWNGDLTTDREIKGTLAEKSVKELLVWAEEHRLTIKFDLYHEAERAHLELANGKVAEVVVDGKPDLAALPRVELWRDGDWRAALKPMFVEETAPVFIPEGDMTPTPISLPQMDPGEKPPWLELKESAPPPDSMAWLTPAQSVPAIPQPPEPPVQTPAERVEPTFGSQPVQVPVESGRIEPTFDVYGATVPQAPAIDQQMQAGMDTAQVNLPPRRGWVVAGVLGGVAVLAGATAIGVHVFRKPEPVVQQQPPPQQQVTPMPDAAVAELEPQRPKRKPEHDRPAPSKAEIRDRAKRLIDKARREIIEGKKKSAIALLEEARKLEPDNVGIRIYLAQAKGKLGESVLWVESKPKGAHVIVDGADVGQTPVKLKSIPAGEHTVVVGDRSEDIEIIKDKKKRLKFDLRGRVARGSKGQ
jgi:PEGA domain-containing protein